MISNLHAEPKAKDLLCFGGTISRILVEASKADSSSQDSSE